MTSTTSRGQAFRGRVRLCRNDPPSGRGRDRAGGLACLDSRCNGEIPGGGIRAAVFRRSVRGEALSAPPLTKAKTRKKAVG